jgi:hypothetical protein
VGRDAGGEGDGAKLVGLAAIVAAEGFHGDGQESIKERWEELQS